MYRGPIVPIDRPPASCRKIGVDQKLKISLEWPNAIQKIPLFFPVP